MDYTTTLRFRLKGQQICQHLHYRNSALHFTLACRRAFGSGAVTVNDQYQSQQPPIFNANRASLSQQAQQKEANKEFFAGLLSAAVSKRDAKVYLTRLKNLQKKKSPPIQSTIEASGPYVGRKDLSQGVRAAETIGITAQPPLVTTDVDGQEDLHIALVKIKDVADLSSETLLGIAETMALLNRLSITPCIMIEASKDRAQQGEELNKIVDAINQFGDDARRIDNVFITAAGQTQISQSRTLLQALSRNHIPVVTNAALNEDEQIMTVVPVHDAMLALTRDLASLSTASSEVGKNELDPITIKQRRRQISLDRIITIDSAGGIHNNKGSDSRHVFLNLEQEYEGVRHVLESKTNDTTAAIHLANLDLLDQILRLLPSTSSGLMTTHAEAANHRRSISLSTNSSNVGTRRQKNALIHNILTDKPAYSCSLPLGRLPTSQSINEPVPLPSCSSFVKRGMLLTVLPDPLKTPWSSTASRIKLTDPEINLPRLVHLIEDSFGRKLDLGDYLRRVNDRIAGVIIAGDYVGGAILTWETLSDAPDAEPVPYLDKFAVLKEHQGSGGIADILFNAMVGPCFPNGVCWRSRKNNPVNKWYFERSRGTWKIPNTNWTMFYTTPAAELSEKTFSEYESVCRRIAPSWADRERIAD